MRSGGLPPRRGEIAQYIPGPWRTEYSRSHWRGEQICYDAPDYLHAQAMRVDTSPP